MTAPPAGKPAVLGEVQATHHRSALAVEPAAGGSAPLSDTLPTAHRGLAGPALHWTLVAGVVVALGVLGIAGALSGWIWPLLFLGGAVVVGLRVGRRPWLVVGMVVVTALLMSAPDSLVAYVGTVWLWLAAHVGAAALVGSARRWMPGSVVLWHLAFLLPRGERRLWRAEVRSVLHACGDDAEARRQVAGFLAAVPATVITSWRTRR